jgi:hypothetical protein
MSEIQRIWFDNGKRDDIAIAFDCTSLQIRWPFKRTEAGITTMNKVFHAVCKTLECEGMMVDCSGASEISNATEDITSQPVKIRM